MAKIVHIVGTSDTGKENVTRDLVNLIEKDRYKALKLREPEPLRDLIKKYKLRYDKNPWTEAALFSTDRLITYTKEVIPRMTEENLVFVFDRGLPDTVIYQGVIGGVDIDKIFLMNSLIPSSDIYLCLTVDGKIGHNRALKKQKETGETPTKNETPEAINRVAAAYKEHIPRYFSNTNFVDTSNLTIDKVTKLCYEKVRPIL